MPPKRRLLTPGPTPVPPEVLAALAEPVLHHRAPDFKDVFRRVHGSLQEVFRTENEVLVLTASGTGGFESALVNLLSAGEPVLVVSCGEFGERWAALAAALGCKVEPLAYAWGEAPHPDDLARRLAETRAEVVLLVHSETSTGVVVDLEPLVETCRAAGAVAVVDAISSLGAVPLETDAWNVDVVVTGSQKALMSPPGLAFVSVSERARRRSESAKLPRFYWDWALARTAQAEGTTPFTPAVSTLVALDVALERLLAEGLQAAFARHVAVGRACRAGAKAMGLELYSPDDDSAAVLTAILTPDGVDAVALRLALRDRHGITIAGGHGNIADRLFRIGHIGYVDVFDITTALAAVELELAEAGAEIERGVAVAAALDAYDTAVRASPPAGHRDRRPRNVSARVLIREPIAEAGIALLRGRFEVDVDGESDLAEIIGRYDAIVVRSATKLTAELIQRGERLRVIGRAGVGVDNVDVEAATRRGIVVANAPESTVVSAAEHTIGLLVALARNIPQAHAALKQGRWERSSWGGVELAGKTLGVLGFGRIGRQVARRALGLGMRVVAYDPFVSAERVREQGAEHAESADAVLAVADFLTLHLPLTEETRGFLDAAALARLPHGARIVNAARGELVDEQALADAVRSGRVAGAALDVFSEEPYTGPLLGLDGVVVTPHLAASTAEAQDRAGVIVAEQVAAALAGELVTNAVNIPSIDAADLEVLGPFVPLAAALGRLAAELAEGAPARILVAAHGPLAGHDTRLLTAAALNGAFSGRVDQAVNYVNAPLIAAERGIEVTESRDQASRDYTNLVRVKLTSEGGEYEVSGTTIGPEPRLFLAGALGYAIDIELAARMVMFRYDDVPGVIGRVGTLFGEFGVNIANMAVSRTKEGGKALMALSIDSTAPLELVERIRAEGFDDTRFLQLA